MLLTSDKHTLESPLIVQLSSGSSHSIVDTRIGQSDVPWVFLPDRTMLLGCIAQTTTAKASVPADKGTIFTYPTWHRPPLVVSIAWVPLVLVHASHMNQMGHWIGQMLKLHTSQRCAHVAGLCKTSPQKFLSTIDPLHRPGLLEFDGFPAMP